MDKDKKKNNKLNKKNKVENISDNENEYIASKNKNDVI